MPFCVACGGNLTERVCAGCGKDSQSATHADAARAVGAASSVVAESARPDADPERASRSDSAPADGQKTRLKRQHGISFLHREVRSASPDSRREQAESTEPMSLAGAYDAMGRCASSPGPPGLGPTPRCAGSRICRSRLRTLSHRPPPAACQLLHAALEDGRRHGNDSDVHVVSHPQRCHRRAARPLLPVADVALSLFLRVFIGVYARSCDAKEDIGKARYALIP